MESQSSDELDFFSALTAPLALEPEKAAPDLEAKLAPVIPQKDLAVGEFTQADRQASFIEQVENGTGREVLEAVLKDLYPARLGQKFLLCGRHYLVIDSVIEPPQLWMALLEDNRLFVPWPDVLAADLFHHTAPAVVMVQPDPYIASMILSYYKAKLGTVNVIEELK